MTVDDELFKKANIVFAIEGGGVQERAAGKFAVSGTTGWGIGTGPKYEYIESPTAHNLREISGGPKASRQLHQVFLEMDCKNKARPGAKC